MATTDVIVIGAGLVGLSLARELHRQGLRATLFEAQKTGREASWAGAGMLAAYQTADAALRPLAVASARLYPTWVAELERETYLNVGYRKSGTLFFSGRGHAAPEPTLPGWERVSGAQVSEWEPALRLPAETEAWRIADDHSVDNRALAAALEASVRARGLELRENARVLAVERNASGLVVVCNGERHSATVVVNAAGAWASSIPAPVTVAIRPRKGQMLRLAGGPAWSLRHVIAAPGVYLVPRTPGQVLVGATLEDVGFNAEVSSRETAEMHRRAALLVPALAQAEVAETWAGFRPCSQDELPILGPSTCPGYWLATGYFRDGILLAPISAKIIARAIATGQMTRALNLDPFLPRSD